jgi:HEAT repeat protein
MEEAGQGHDRLEALVDGLMDDDEEARYEKAREIAAQGRWVIPRIIELADDPRARMREMAARVLGQVGYPDPNDSGWLIRYPDGIPTLVRRLESDPDHDVRTNAAIALGFQKEPSTVPALCRAASDPSEYVRYGVAMALGKFWVADWEQGEERNYRSQIRSALLRLMDDDDEDVRDWATFGLRDEQYDDPEVRRRLWQALDDPNAEVRGEAASALAGFGDRMLIPRLETLLREDTAISPCYIEAAQELGDPSLLPAVLAAAERWRETMEEGEEMHFMITSAIEALQKAENPPAEPSAKETAIEAPTTPE